MAKLDDPRPASPSFDPGWSEATWQGAEPPALPTPTLLQRVRGVYRVTGFLLATLALLPIFFAARAMGGRRDRAIAALWCRAGLWLAGVRLTTYGTPMRTGGAIMANHASWLDIMAIGAAAPVHFVAKSEIANWPVFGWIGKISNTVFIARKRAQAKEQEKMLSQRASEGDLLCIFPEGTSSDGLRVLPFKSALFSIFVNGSAGEHGARVQPVALRYFAPPGLPPSFHGWWGRMPLFGHVVALVCLGHGGRAAIAFLPPMEPGPQDTRKTLAAAAERAVREAHRTLGEGGTPDVGDGSRPQRPPLKDVAE